MTRSIELIEGRLCLSVPRGGHGWLAHVTWLLLSPVAARADWLEEVPSVEDVARAAREQNQQDAIDPNRFRPSNGFRTLNGLKFGPRRISADDHEWYAARLAGTFELLRWLMLFEALRETNPDMPSEWLPLTRRFRPYRYTRLTITGLSGSTRTGTQCFAKVLGLTGSRSN